MLKRTRRSPSHARADSAGGWGQVLVLFALAAIVILGGAALAVDGGRLFLERRDAQGAADHAASAASFASCTGSAEGAAITAGVAAAARNGYNNDGSTNTVTVTRVSGHSYQAMVESTVGATFGQVLGFSTYDVGAMATADCAGAGGAGPGAAYAGGTCPSAGKFAFDVSGSTNRVYGGVHVNDDANIGGSGNIFTEAAPPDDPFTYVGTITQYLDDLFQDDYPQDVGPALPNPVWPAGFDPSVVTGGAGVPTPGSFLRPYYDLAVANGTYSTSKIDSITKDGVYYTTSTDGMDIGTIDGSVFNVVLVASQGPIKISGSSKTLNAYQHASMPMTGLLMLSNKVYTGDEACDNFTVAVSGSGNNWNGILWGPRGLVEMSGSSNSAVRGALVGHAVRLNGSDQTIRYDSTLFPADPSVFLIR